MKFTNIILTFSIFFSAALGDYLVFRSKYSNSHVFRAFCDTSVHGVIGFLSALLFFSQNYNISSQACIYNILFCTALSSLIDVDHFIVARSLYLKDLLNLRQRGIFHCTTFWLVISTILIFYSHFCRKLNIYILTYMIIIAFSSHHIRDGYRRGLWLYPFGHTPPINKFVYTFSICILPSIFVYIYNCTKPMFRITIVQYTTV